MGDWLFMAYNVWFTRGSMYCKAQLWLTLRVCLFGGEIGWMKKFGKKTRRKNILEGVWLRKGEGKMMVGPTWAHKKVFSSK